MSMPELNKRVGPGGEILIALNTVVGMVRFTSEINIGETRRHEGGMIAPILTSDAIIGIPIIVFGILIVSPLRPIYLATCSWIHRLSTPYWPLGRNERNDIDPRNE
jgi:propanediol utilization protein